jgi:hypothetical protein
MISRLAALPRGKWGVPSFFVRLGAGVRVNPLAGNGRLVIGAAARRG